MDIKNTFNDLAPEIDYQSLMAALPPQSHPRRKLKELQNRGYLIRLKKGFYLLTSNATDKQYSTCIAANLLYGPSYVSLEYALHYYQLIPERIEVVTSVTSQKNKNFETPVGRFTYRHLHQSLYPQGISQKKAADGRNFLIASAEKALLDIFTLKFTRHDRPQKTDLLQALSIDLRIDLAELRPQLNREFLTNARSSYRNRPWCKLLIDYLLELI